MATAWDRAFLQRSMRDRLLYVGGILNMKCFNHPTTDAVALCKSCGRAICPECVTEVGLSCSCRNRCESDVGMLNELVERARTSYQKTSAAYFRVGLFASMMGAVFVLVGVLIVLGGTGVEWGAFLLVLGLLFVGMGISYFVSGKSIGQK